MLVLTRKPEEKIIIRNKKIGDSEIELTVLKVQGGKVSLGIRAGKEWLIVRAELVEADQCQNAEDEQQKLFPNQICEETTSVAAMEFAST